MDEHAGTDTESQPDSVSDRTSRRRRLAEVAYVLGVAAVATGGFASGSTPVILLAVLLALPTGVPALVGYYIVYGLLAQLARANPPSSSGSGSCSPEGVCQESSTGDLAGWFAHTMDLLGVLALAAAALVDVVLWRLFTWRVGRVGPRRRHPAPPQ